MIFNYEKERPKEVMPIAVCLIVSQLNLIWMKKKAPERREPKKIAGSLVF